MSTRRFRTKTFGFTDARRQALVSLIGLQQGDREWGLYLQDAVIIPQWESIVAQFVEWLRNHPEFAPYLALAPSGDTAHLQETQKTYLLSLGVDFDSADYFAGRLRIGLAHAHAHIPLTLYVAAYAHLQRLLLSHIPRDGFVATRAYPSLIEYIMKIIALDMALATEAYHLARVELLERSVRVLRDRARELHRLVDTDTFTGLASHAHILDVLARSLDDASEYPLSLIIIDLDRFKEINDRHGHVVGDHVIRSIARRLTSVARQGDVIGRCGGDEFMMVLRHTAPSVVADIAKRVCDRVGNNAFEVHGLTIRTTVSVGVATAYSGEAAEALTARADDALYRAKRRGRNRVVIDSISDIPLPQLIAHSDDARSRHERQTHVTS